MTSSTSGANRSVENATAPGKYVSPPVVSRMTALVASLGRMPSARMKLASNPSWLRKFGFLNGKWSPSAAIELLKTLVGGLTVSLTVVVFSRTLSPSEPASPS